MGSYTNRLRIFLSGHTFRCMDQHASPLFREPFPVFDVLTGMNYQPCPWLANGYNQRVDLTARFNGVFGLVTHIISFPCSRADKSPSIRYKIARLSSQSATSLHAADSSRNSPASRYALLPPSSSYIYPLISRSFHSYLETMFLQEQQLWLCISSTQFQDWSNECSDYYHLRLFESHILSMSSASFFLLRFVLLLRLLITRLPPIMKRVAVMTESYIWLVRHSSSFSRTSTSCPIKYAGRQMQPDCRAAHTGLATVLCHTSGSPTTRW